MVTGIIGRKVGMTQVFEADGTVVPATVIKAGPCVVVQAKTRADRRLRGRAARPGRRDAGRRPTSRPSGHYKKAGVPPTRVRREVKIAPGGDARQGRAIRCSSTSSAAGDRVDVIGTSRGQGFQGVMKRHHFAGGAATHGSMFHRAPGSIGASSFPSRVVKGMRAAGRMGGDRVTTRNLKVVSVDAERPPARAARRGARARPAASSSCAGRSRASRIRSRRSRSRRRARSRPRSHELS